MGTERRVRFAGESPTWDAIKAQLLRVGEPAPLRMIDGMPAFPDETPDAGWNELRVGTAAGMVTVRRAPGGFACVVWGNADGPLKVAWDRVCWACAAAGGGAVETTSGAIPADEFAAAAGLSPT